MLITTSSGAVVRASDGSWATRLALATTLKPQCCRRHASPSRTSTSSPATIVRAAVDVVVQDRSSVGTVIAPPHTQAIAPLLLSWEYPGATHFPPSNARVSPTPVREITAGVAGGQLPGHLVVLYLLAGSGSGASTSDFEALDGNPG